MKREDPVPPAPAEMNRDDQRVMFDCLRHAKAFWFKWAFIATGATVVGLYGMVFLNKI